MNKVISVEIAKQVFWIDDDAYTDLKTYFSNIHDQLVNEDGASEIYQDIELRVAELLFDYSPSDKKAITQEQLKNVIEQVGFIDTTDNEVDETVAHNQETNRKAYLDAGNKIVGGVCSGLAIRFKVPAFVLRILFLSLILVFGLGLALYVIFWISLENNNTRYSSLVANGKAPTANKLAKAQLPKESPVYTLQRILFLPFSIIGTLIGVMLTHFSHRKHLYAKVAKNLVAIGLFIIGITIFTGFLEFNANHYFHSFFSWVLGFAVTYLIVITLLIYVKEYYLSKPVVRVDKRLKVAALVPIVIIGLSVYSLNRSQTERAIETINQAYQIPNDGLTIQFNDSHDDGESRLSERAQYVIKSSNEVRDTVNVTIEYASWGVNVDEARVNTTSIDYQYDYQNGVLSLDLNWFLNPDTYFRGQRVKVLIDVPTNIQISTNRPLIIDQYKDGLDYLLGYASLDSEFIYYASSGYIHEWGDDFVNKLSENELAVMQTKFCEEFFISEFWGCRSNIVNRLDYNHRFDQAFNKDKEKIAAIKEFLQPNRSVFVSNLDDIHSLLGELSVKYSVKSNLQTYIEHLKRVKEQQVVSLVLVAQE